MFGLSVRSRSGESQEDMLKRFRKEVSKAGILKALRKKRWFVSRSEKRRIAKAKAIRKLRRKKTRVRPDSRGRGRR
ncbi:MAG TPA: 30S ribosomal protein S21 [Anaerolineae bacterium]|nr:30S ribosomal protein S21 [Anaerolineae bacterium]